MPKPIFNADLDIGINNIELNTKVKLLKQVTKNINEINYCLIEESEFMR